MSVTWVCCETASSTWLTTDSDGMQKLIRQSAKTCSLISRDLPSGGEYKGRSSKGTLWSLSHEELDHCIRIIRLLKRVRERECVCLCSAILIASFPGSSSSAFGRILYWAASSANKAIQSPTQLKMECMDNGYQNHTQYVTVHMFKPSYLDESEIRFWPPLKLSWIEPCFYHLHLEMSGLKDWFVSYCSVAMPTSQETSLLVELKWHRTTETEVNWSLAISVAMEATFAIIFPVELAGGSTWTLLTERNGHDMVTV